MAEPDWKLLLDALPLPAFAAGNDGASVWKNAAFAALGGDVKAQILHQLRMTAPGATDAGRIDTVLPAADGPTRSFAWHWRRADPGAPHLMVFIGVDMTGVNAELEQRAVRQSAAEQAHRALQAAIQNLSEGITIIDDTERVVLVNERMKLFYPAGAAGHVIGENLESLIRQSLAAGEYGEIAVEEHDSFAHALMDDIRNGRSREQRFGNGRWAIISSARMPGGGLLSLWTDITALKDANRALSLARIAAEEASQAKTTFLAHMSHEFRTPLNAIIGFSDLIQMQIFGPLQNEKYVEYLGNIASSAHHLNQLVGAVLDISRIEAGKLALSREQVAVQDLFADVLALLPKPKPTWPRIATRGVTANAAFWADRTAVRQALLNLLTNAIKACGPDDQVWLEYRAADGLVELEVGDTGRGLSEQEVEVILAPFGQVNDRADIARADRGIGLGVPIAKGIAEAHGGRLRYIGAPGQGTRAIVTIRVRADGDRTGPQPTADRRT